MSRPLNAITAFIPPLLAVFLAIQRFRPGGLPFQPLQLVRREFCNLNSIASFIGLIFLPPLRFGSCDLSLHYVVFLQPNLVYFSHQSY